MEKIKIKIKKIVWKIIRHMPFRLRYVLSFRADVGYWPHLLFPRDYRDFIFRDNFLNRHKKHAYLADKLEVRKYVEERGLSNSLTRLYGAWSDADMIDFDSLPNQFALKCNHSCGMNIIVTDKNKLDIDATRKQLNEWLHTKHPIYFERHYNYIKPMVICEELIPNDKDGFFPMDYKIHCANGKPVFIQCCFERTNDDVGRRVIYSTDWKNLHYVLNDDHYTEIELPRPKHLDELLRAAAILSEGLDYARVDFYDTETRIIFGEVTLTPMGGLLSYFSQEAVELMGKAIRDNIKK